MKRMNSIVKCCLVRSNPLFPCGACALERERVHRLVYLDGFFFAAAAGCIESILI